MIIIVQYNQKEVNYISLITNFVYLYYLLFNSQIGKKKKTAFTKCTAVLRCPVFRSNMNTDEIHIMAGCLINLFFYYEYET